MYQENYSCSFDLKEKFQNFKKIIGIAIILCAVLSMIYFIYWGMVVNDKYILELTSKYFIPIAGLFSNITTTEMFKIASLKLLALTAPLFGLYYITDIIEEKTLKIHYDLVQAKIKQAQIKKLLLKEKEFDLIKQFSICLSIDYNSDNKKISDNTKQKINNIIFNKIKNCFLKFPLKINFNISNVFILTSADFKNYDFIYKNLIDVLAKYKKLIEKNLNITMIPGITTDADNTGYLNLTEIKQQHFGIQNCINRKNFSCATSLFLKKYKHLNKNIYQGMPIGEYILNNNKTYELNMIAKDLNKELDKI